jgi:uncharacterized membrane protein
MLETLVVLNVLLILGIVVGVFVIYFRIDKAATATAAKLDETQRELGETLRTARGTLRQIESLAARTESEMDRVDNVLKSVDHLVSGAVVAEAAVKAVKGGHASVTSVLAGVKEGLRVLRSRSDQPKED